MPYRPKVLCKQPGCAAMVMPGKQYCEIHLKLHPEVTRSAGKRGYGSLWQKESKRFLLSHPLCVECMKQGRQLLEKTRELIQYGILNEDDFKKVMAVYHEAIERCIEESNA